VGATGGGQLNRIKFRGSRHTTMQAAICTVVTQVGRGGFHTERSVERGDPRRCCFFFSCRGVPAAGRRPHFTMAGTYASTAALLKVLICSWMPARTGHSVAVLKVDLKADGSRRRPARVRRSRALRDRVTASGEICAGWCCWRGCAGFPRVRCVGVRHVGPACQLRR